MAGSSGNIWVDECRRRPRRRKLGGPRLTKDARQGLRALRPTRPAGRGSSFGRPRLAAGATRDSHLDFAPWHAPGGQAPGLRPGKPAGLPQGTRRKETVVVVTVRRHVVVATGRADVRRLIVERAAPQHAACRWPPSGRRWYQTGGGEGTRRSLGAISAAGALTGGPSGPRRGSRR
jgi:hypothetical protein